MWVKYLLLRVGLALTGHVFYGFVMNHAVDDTPLLGVMQKYWGYDTFLPLQQEAMGCAMAGQDSLVVLPTGGGKSLCYQAPALCSGGVAVVVSPLISLMKDQVDALQTIGAPAACVNSSTSYQEKRHITRLVRSGELKLLYMSPEKLLAERTFEFLKAIDAAFFAIDEAHCISQWGHDFRPEYRGLSALKENFPEVGVHAFTATASQQVRQDIVQQLTLSSAQVLVGSFDRPNLIYKVQRRDNVLGQLTTVIDRWKNESGIVYCITRKEVERTAASLTACGYKALPYHAGMTDVQRRHNQEAFMKEQASMIVATVAFGMGIDKSNVRFVIHTGMPKSLEHYQQESGRAGRDGLNAECCLFYSPGDLMLWKKILMESEHGASPGAMQALESIGDYCASATCRHETIVQYFGQTLRKKGRLDQTHDVQHDAHSCQACDICLGDVELVEDPVVVGQKILSCVLRLNEGYGADYTSLVLIGSQDQRILQQGHDKLSTYALMSDFSRRTVRDWIEQLVAQGYLQRTDDFQLLQVTTLGRRLLKAEVTPRLLAAADKPQRSAGEDWAGVDRGLFDELKKLRIEKAQDADVSAYVVFGDAVLRDMARYRPSTPEGLLKLHGVGEKRLQQWGDEFVQCIVDYSRESELELDLEPPHKPRVERKRKLNSAAAMAFPFFEQGVSVEDAAEKLNRAVSTVMGYLQQYIEQKNVTDPSPWVDAATAERVREAVKHVGDDRLSPIHEFLNKEVDYGAIRVVVSCMENE